MAHLTVVGTFGPVLALEQVGAGLSLKLRSEKSRMQYETSSQLSPTFSSSS